jgi:DNA-binding MarR family transcriptional regulator
VAANLPGVEHPPTWFANLDLQSPAAEVSALLGALVPAIERRFQKVVSQQGLTKAQAQLLAQLPTDQALSQREMSERLRCAPSSVVGVIDSLEKRGWLTRRVDSADRRINVLVLTPAGREAREHLLQQLLEPPTAISRLSMPEQEQLRDVLRTVVQELDARD